MIGRKQQLNLLLAQLSDGIILVLAYWLAYFLRYLGAIYFGWSPAGAFSAFAWAMFPIMPLGPLLLDQRGYYTRPFQKTVGNLIVCIVKAGVILSLIVLACAFFMRYELPSRGSLLILAGLAPALLLARYLLTVAYMRKRYGSERFRDRALVVGADEDVERFRNRMHEEQSEEMQIVGVLNMENQTAQDLTKALHSHSVNRVVILGGRSHLDRVQEAITACEVEGVEVWLIADFIHTSIARVEVEIMNGRPLLVFRCTSGLEWSLMMKKAIDLIGGLFLLIVTSPLFFIAMIGIKLTSPGPIFFLQKRSGKNGKPFSMIKFRSMSLDAEIRRAELEKFNQMGGPVFKMEKDPRITPFGNLLRKTSIDELPQLINVLRGEMSLVGPRPLPLYEVAKFESTSHRRRLSVKPGLTCLWQIKGRNRVTSFQDWVRLDLEYIDNWSIWLDIKILAQTVPVVLFGVGAK